MFTFIIEQYVRTPDLFVTVYFSTPLKNGKICQATWHGMITVYIWQDKCGPAEYLTRYETTAEYFSVSGEFVTNQT